MTDPRIVRCERCQAPVSVKQHVDGSTVTVNAHPQWQPTPGTYVVLADGRIRSASIGTVHCYQRHTCREVDE